MRFKTEQEGLQHIKEKEVPDPRSWSQGKKECTARIKLQSKSQALEIFNKWIDLKRYMFSPEELKALRGYDHRNIIGQRSQATRDSYINVFIDWTEGKPMKESLMSVAKELFL